MMMIKKMTLKQRVVLSVVLLSNNEDFQREHRWVVIRDQIPCTKPAEFVLCLLHTDHIRSL